MTIRFRKTPTRELSDWALDWALSKALCPEFMTMAINPHSGLSFWSESWLGNLPANRSLIANHLQEQYRIDVYYWKGMSPGEPCPENAQWQATYQEKPEDFGGPTQVGPDTITVIFRLVVFIKLGEHVEIPEMLIDMEKFRKESTHGDDCRESGMEQTNNGSAV